MANLEHSELKLHLNDLCKRLLEDLCNKQSLKSLPSHILNIINNNIKNMRQTHLILDKLTNLSLEVYRYINRIPIFEQSNTFVEYNKLFIEEIKKVIHSVFIDKVNELDKYFVNDDNSRTKKFGFFYKLFAFIDELPEILKKNNIEISEDPNIDTNEEDLLLILKELKPHQLTSSLIYEFYLQAKRSKFQQIQLFLKTLDPNLDTY